MFKTTILTALSGLAIGLAGIPAVQAAATDGKCEMVGDAMVCINLVSSNRGVDVWEVGYSDGETSEVFDIPCQDYSKSVIDWSSYGNMSQSQAEAFTEGFCGV